MENELEDDVAMGARGIIIGLALGIVLWAVIAVMVAGGIVWWKGRG